MDTIFSGRYQIKIASNTDINKIITLLKEVAQWLKNKNIDQWQYLLNGGDDEEIKESISNQKTYMILEDCELIATFTVSSTQNDWDRHIFGENVQDHSLYLHRLAVAPKHMGEGIGKNILQWIQSHIKTDKQYLKLDCVSHNAKLNQFYRNNGFEYLGETDGHSKYHKKLKVVNGTMN